MVLLNCLVYVWLLSMPPMEMEKWFMLLAVSRETVLAGEWWRLISYGFVHLADFHLHLVANMVVLVVVGRPLEQLLGWWGMAAVYFGGLVAGAILQSVVFEPNLPLVGASAAVFALLLAFCRFFWMETLRVWLGFVIPVNLRGRSVGLGILIGSFILWLASLNQDGVLAMIGHWAHIGGALWGLLYVRVRYYKKLPVLEALQEERSRREKEDGE